MADADGITALGAVHLSAAIRGRAVSCLEVMQAYLDRIGRLNPTYNAIVALRNEDDLLREAARADAMLARGEPVGPLHGFPLAVKDLDPVRGLPFTQGSPIFANRIAEADSIMVARLRAAGAIFTGKTNIPEFGLGSQSFNPVYGVTACAYDPARTGGGSSGGAAVAVALRLQPVADGTDNGGSLRNPPAFANVYGLRTCWGRIPSEGKDVFSSGLTVSGAIGRSPSDIGLMLSVQAGYDPRCPNAIRQDPGGFAGPLARDFRGVRIAWLGDFGGAIPFEPGVLETCRAAAATFAEIGCLVEEAVPDYDIEQVWQDWLVLRAFTVAGNLRPLLADPAHRDLLKQEAVWEAERGLALTADQLNAALEGRTRWYETVRRFMDLYDFLLMPTAQVFPFDKTVRWPAEVGGRTMDTYHRWMQIAVPATMAGLPALAIPAGFGPGGLPTGLQIVGRNHGELACLQLGAAYDAATGWVQRQPPPVQ
ncbi:amidase [Methylobacterium aerolatum]|uniref:Amidase n=1 Tax=Methylobacterium aerolatum TaxID=418708 RepID=A0ABU0HUS4_9HYPH|nr:amidase [Methylobacterium aerolatum]MDQ0445573.1 amidase [Methylobacterium aerolatum]GJD36316.1 Acylamidase [Methylobacterium aerolatum]